MITQQSCKAVKGHVMSCMLLLFISLFSLSLSAQYKKIRVKGLVENEKGEALEGVTVELISGQAPARQVALTNQSGMFVFDAPAAQGPYVFHISHIGYTAQTLRKEKLDAEKEEALYIILKTSTTSLDEVVVSYGRQRRRDVTGAIVQLDAAGVKDMPVGQFAQQLQGKIPGVQVDQTNGQPGRGMQFRIRGAASLALGNQPLFVVDGIPITGSINNINPSEIESITVLKDASASALYGSRAANGVVLIVTKHARPGDAKIELNAWYGVQAIPQKGRPKLMTAREFAEFENEYYEDKAKYENSTATVPDIYKNPERYGEGTNWFNTLTRNAPIQHYDLTFTTGTDKASSAVMVGYQDQQGVILNTGTRLFTLRLNQDFSFNNKKLKIGFGLAPSYRIDHNSRLSTEGVNGLIEKIVEASPLIAPVDENGNMPQYVSTTGMVANLNPYAQFMLKREDYKTGRLLGNTYLNYQILDGLMLKTNVALDKGAETSNQFTPAFISSTGVATGLSSSVDNYSWTAEATLNYTKTFFKYHHIEALVGYSAQQFDQESNTVSGTNFASEEVPWLSTATAISAGSSNTTHYSLLSEIARLNYNYKDKYLLSGAIRRDGSSRFGALRKYGNFPSVSAGWIISNERFMENIKPVNFLKIRASYGITGNNDLGNYQAVSQVGQSNYVLGNTLVPGLAPSSVGNQELAWERNKQWDIGVDLSVLNNRLTFTYDYYHKLSDGLIQERPIPRASGYTSITSNVGALALWGHEFSVNANIIDKKDLQWNAAFNISFNRNIIKSLVAPGFIRRNNTITSDYWRNQVGHHLGAFYGFVFEGLYKDEQDLANSAKYGTSSAVGTIKMKDVVEDGVINESDRTFIGDPNPDFLYGFTNTVTYKRFDLSVAVSGSVGGQILNASRWAYLTNLDGARMLLAAAKDRWRSPENPGSGIYPRTLTGTTALGRSVNSQWLEDATYLTVKNITLGYNIGLGNSLAIKAIRVYASVQNAFIFTGYTGINPEISLDGLNGRSQGIDENAYPTPRTFALGFTATFK
ncbi:TonB-dependent receptor [Chitinophaga agrisoli]|uniref:TonB-dependent receptor n=1 Tax=Chitinophaga agrisoli TaxID=2607653 RepID=A0A5B2W277_9BACT|nr:TonB-dependent receptor [Chitinophaga agrisoli]KAA2245741.1 TonB-dependent receptor [Chitinophaga agrisoli]